MRPTTGQRRRLAGKLSEDSMKVLATHNSLNSFSGFFSFERCSALAYENTCSEQA